MTASKPRLRSEREKGNITVELALVLPIFLLVVAGIIDIGMLFWEKEVLTNASREGARAAARAAVSGAAEKRVGEVRQIVQDYLNKFALKDDAGAPVTLVTGTNFFYQWDTSVTPARLWVDLQNIPVKMMLLPNIQALFKGDGISNTVNLNAKTTMAAEWGTVPSP